MPRIRISKSSLREATGDWRNAYNNDKLKILEFLKNNQSGGANTTTGAALRLTGFFVRLVIIILIIFTVYLIVYGSYKKYVEKNEEYRDLDPVAVLKKSLMDFFENIKSAFISLGKIVGIEEEKPVILKASEVYNLGDNHYTYEEAKQACSMLGARLATRAEVKGAYNKGAEWCNYGWSEGGEALYPTQEKTVRMLKRAGREGECGVPGVNGGHFYDKETKFGANCYGVKPSPNSDNILNVDCSDPKVVQLLDTATGQYGIKYNCKVDGRVEPKMDMNTLTSNIMPFNNYTWGEDSSSNRLYIGDNSLARNGLGVKHRMKSEGFAGGRETFSGKNEIDKTVLTRALCEIRAYLEGRPVCSRKMPTETLASDIRKIARSENPTEEKQQIVNIALNKIMQIFKSHKIPLDNKKIDAAINHYDDIMIHKHKREIDYKLTPFGINAIYLNNRK